MASISHSSESTVGRKPRWQLKPGIAEMWASIAISMMWVAVAVDALWGPNFSSTSSTGSSTTIPSAVFVAFFAWLGTRVVAKYGFRHTDD